MKTRSDLYGREATGLLRVISLYPGLSSRQLCGFYPGREDKAKSVLATLKKQGRIEQAENGGWFVYGADFKSTDPGMNRAVWVLLDFIERAEFHSSTDFPVKLIFLAEAEVYEVIDLPSGQETLIAQLLRQTREESGRRIVIVDAPEQIPKLDIPGVSAFCTVSVEGRVSYYQKSSAEGGN